MTFCGDCVKERLDAGFGLYCVLLKGLINMNVISWCSHLFLPGTYRFAIVVKIQSVWLLLSINDYLFLTPLLTGLDYTFFLVCHGLFLCSRINVHILVRLIVYFITKGFFLVWCTQIQNSPCNFNTPCIGTETEMLSIESNRNTQLTCIRYCWDILKKIKISLCFTSGCVYKFLLRHIFLQCSNVPLFHLLKFLSAWFSYPITLDVDNVYEF
jgi:hypothetical protein